ncbi:MAG: cation:proton antiporter [Acidiferrobacterales bacterium]|nr:cation:proton antiporter [Acidiferrobacterales bacterium]
MLALILILALISGLVFRTLGFPPLLGYLLTGFAAQAWGVGSSEAIEPFAEFGITLLLFTIGLKLDLNKLAAPQVWGVTLVQMLISVLLMVPVLLLAMRWVPSLAIEDQSVAWTLAFALSFSSTVFAVKIFDTRGENASFHATIAIGILVIQDLIAVVYLVATSGKTPSIYTAGLLLLPVLRPLLLNLLKRVGHGELLLLFGIGMAIGAHELFEWLQLKGGLGALICGVVLGSTAKSNELYKGLVQLKDLFLIGFFLLIGYYGLPDFDMWIMAIILCIALLLRPVSYFILLLIFRLRARTAFLSGFSLFNYSEFGLIVAAIAAEAGTIPYEWLTTLALAMALSFFISTPVNTRIHTIFSRYFSWTSKYERENRLPVEHFPDLGDISVAVMGMGRVGLGAYNYLLPFYTDRIVGVEESDLKAKAISETGVHCVHGDATDQAFWLHTKLNNCEKIFVCLSNHRENLYVVNLARENGFRGDFAVVSRFPDEERELNELGCVTFNLYAEAGHGFAEHAMAQMDLINPSPSQTS